MNPDLDLDAVRAAKAEFVRRFYQVFCTGLALGFFTVAVAFVSRGAIPAWSSWVIALMRLAQLVLAVRFIVQTFRLSRALGYQGGAWGLGLLALIPWVNLGVFVFLLHKYKQATGAQLTFLMFDKAQEA